MYVGGRLSTNGAEKAGELAAAEGAGQRVPDAEQRQLDRRHTGDLCDTSSGLLPAPGGFLLLAHHEHTANSP